jgi:hypothetical protein
VMVTDAAVKADRLHGRVQAPCTQPQEVTVTSACVAANDTRSQDPAPKLFQHSYQTRGHMQRRRTGGT